MVEKGSDSSSEKGGVPGTPSTQSLGSRNFIRNSKVGASSGGVGAGWEDRGIQGILLTPFLSLAEDAELVQCKYLGRGPCRRDEGGGQVLGPGAAGCHCQRVGAGVRRPWGVVSSQAATYMLCDLE